MGNGEPFGPTRAEAWFVCGGPWLGVGVCACAWGCGCPCLHSIHHLPPSWTLRHNLTFSYSRNSFNDGVGILAKMWENAGDIEGSYHLLKLAQESEAPLCKWTPVPCPFIASGAGESVNQMFKSSPGHGATRQKLTYLQQVSVVGVRVGVRALELGLTPILTLVGAKANRNFIPFVLAIEIRTN